MRIDGNGRRWRERIGEQHQHLGMAYVCVGGRSRYTGRGAKTIVPLWEGTCTDCGAAHRFTTSQTPVGSEWRPRCGRCRKGKRGIVATAEGKETQARWWRHFQALGGNR